MTSFRRIALVLSFCALGVLSAQDADAQRRSSSRSMTQSSDTDFYVVVRGAYPFTSITKIGGAGIVGFGYRFDDMFRAELEFIYGAITAEVEESGSGEVLLNPLAPVGDTNPALINPTIPVNFEADNDNFLFMTNFYMDIPEVFPKKWGVKPYVGFSLGYANTNTTPDYGNAGDVTEATVPVATEFEKLVNPQSTAQTAANGRAFLNNTYQAARSRLSGTAQANLPASLSFTAGQEANQYGGQRAARNIAYSAIATGIVNGSNFTTGNNTTRFIPGIKQNIPVGELTSFVVGIMAGVSGDLGDNFFMDGGYRWVYAQQEIKNFHEIRLGFGYNFDIDY